LTDEKFCPPDFYDFSFRIGPAEATTITIKFKKI
jgi:hypothetical protein